MTEFKKYIQRYLNLLPSDNWKEAALLSENKTAAVLANLSDEQAMLAYAPEKWAIKEVLQHLIDTERIFQYRILAILRGEQQELPGFNEEFYAANSAANSRNFASLLDEFFAVRKSTYFLVETAVFSALKNTGTANGNLVSAETVAKLIVGHNIHHLNIIQERYLPLL